MVNETISNEMELNKRMNKWPFCEVFPFQFFMDLLFCLACIKCKDSTVHWERTQPLLTGWYVSVCMRERERER